MFDPVLDERALELRRAGAPMPAIRAELGYGSLADVEAALLRAREASPLTMSPAEVRDLELERIDRLQLVWWGKATKGDAEATKIILLLSAERRSLVGTRDVGDMVALWDESIGALDLKPEDKALAGVGRRIAMRIDVAAMTGDSVAETKALYLVPHMMNVLRELGATPAARAALKVGSKGPAGGKLTLLRQDRSSAAG